MTTRGGECMQLSQEVAPGVVLVAHGDGERGVRGTRARRRQLGAGGCRPGGPSTVRSPARGPRTLRDRPPAAIVLTHAHFDHVGNLQRPGRRMGRARLRPSRWSCRTSPAGASYPPPDPTVGGGLMAGRAPLPSGLSTSARACGRCPTTGRYRRCRDGGGGTRPATPMDTCRCSATPIAMLVSGDAVITVRQESSARC